MPLTRLHLLDPSRDVVLPDGLPFPVRVLALDPESRKAAEVVAGSRGAAGSAAGGGGSAGRGAELLDFESFARALRADFPRRYVAYVAGLSRANGANPDWWALSIVGRNPLSSRLPLRLLRFLVAEAAAKASLGGTLVAVSADPVLGRQLAAWARAQGVEASGRVRGRSGWTARLSAWLPLGPVFAFLRSAWQALAARLALRFTPEPGVRYTLVATLLNHQSFDASGRYRDTYFGDLPQRLAARGLRPLVFGPITHRFEETLARCAAATAAEGFPVLPMSLFLGPGDLAGLLGRSLRYRLFGFPLRGEARFEGLGIEELLKAELDDDIRPTRLYTNLEFRSAARSLLGKSCAERMLYPFENRAWERMLLQAVAASAPGLPTAGYQHATVTEFHLNFLLAPGEAEILPLPDRIVTMGAVTLQRLKASGFPEERLVEGCALRQSPVAKVSDRPPSARRLFVTLASSPEEYRRSLRLLDEALAPLGDKPEVLLRPHPVIPLEEPLRESAPRFGYRVDPAASFEEGMAWADVVLFASSTLGLEAVRRGVPAVFLDVGDLLRTDPMEDFTALKWSVRAPEELRAALRDIAALAPGELAARRGRAASYCAVYCREVRPEGLEAFGL